MTYIVADDNWNNCPKCDDKKTQIKEIVEVDREGMTVKVEYRCHCRACGFQASFSYSHRLGL